MKFIITFITVFVIFTTTISGSSSSGDYLKNYSFESIFYSILDHRIEKNTYDVDFEFYKNRIPEEYLESFLKATDNLKEYRKVLYAMMLLESQHFTAYESKPNNNGTVDYGPLMMNSSNIKNPEFRKLYFPKEEFFVGLTNTNREDYVVYMIGCINLFKDHINKYSLNDSIRAYNAGPRILKATHWNNRVARSFSYLKRVKYYLNIVEDEYNIHLDHVNNLDENLYNIVI